MPREVAVLAAKRKLERVAAFRQMQAISHQLHTLTDESITIDHFALPDNVHLQPVAPHEVRFVREGDFQSFACIQGDGGAVRQVLPDDLLDVPLLVTSLDQGSIGAAGMAYAINELGMMMSCRFDKIHRLVRDMKLSLSHCCGGVFLKTQLFSSYLYGVNYKPFGTGGFSALKQRLLQVFLATQDIYSDIWCKYKDRIGLDLGMPSSTEDEQHALWEAVANLPSFHHKLSAPKLGRWLSWNNCAHEHMPEFTATKMLFEYHLGQQPDPDEVSTFNVDRDSILAAGRAPNPRAELAALKRASGGLTLAYKLMSSDLQVHVKIAYTATQACWDWYTDEVKTVKTPAHGFQRSVQLAQGRWSWSHHLWHTISHCLYNESSLEFMNMPGNLLGDPAVQQLAHKTLMLVWHLISHRGWSFTRHDCPPECYASVASDNRLEAQATMDLMRRDWKRVVMVEQRVHDLPAARRLCGDLDSLKSQPIRLLFAFFERDQWRLESLAGRKLLKGLLWQLPDNKIVEDCHGHIRRESKANANQKLSISRIQDVVVRSGVFESREVRHPAAVPKEVFVRKRTDKKKHKPSRYYSATHTMSERWTHMMGRRSWNALTEETMHKSAAAWRWLHTYVPGGPAKLDSALFSRLVLPFTLIKNDEGAVYASMGNALWAALGWPLTPVIAGSDEADGSAGVYAFAAEGSMMWIHVTSPLAWYVLPMVGDRAAGGIVFRQTAEPVLLMHFFLVNRRNPKPSYEELVMCAKGLHLEFDVRQPSRQQLLRALADHFNDAAIADDEKEKPAASVAEDPLTEAVFDDMDKQDQMEFPEVHRSILEKRVRRRVAEWAEMEKPIGKKKVGRRKKAVPKKRAGPHGVGPCRKRRRVAAPVPLPPVPPPAPPPLAPPEPEVLPAAPLPGVPAVDVVDDDVPAPAAIPRPVARGARAGPAGPGIPWEFVFCDVCHAQAGQIKLEPSPGMRDGPSWVMRTQDPAEPGAWPAKGPRFRTRRTSVIGEAPTFAKNWVQQNRICCPQPGV
jgi:hypothetical protein